MKFMVMVNGNAAYEAGAMPSERLLAAMGRFNEELANAGVLRAGEGLHPSSRGARIRYHGDERSVVDGPFDDAGSLVSGFWIIEVASKAEAVEWMKRCPNPSEDGAGEVEIRQLFTAEDFGEALTPELREREERLRAQVDGR